METMKLVLSLLATFSIGMSLGEITVPLVEPELFVAASPKTNGDLHDVGVPHRCPCTVNGGVCHCPKDANGDCLCGKLPVQVAEGPKLKPTPLLVPDCFIRTENAKVTDGDTIRCDICFPWHVTLKAETIRAGDYDAWESSKMRRTVHVTDEEVARGKAAAEDLRELLKSGTLYLSPLPNEDRDAYGRLLATFLLVDTRTQQCIFIKEYMSAHGHCRK